MVTLVIGGSGSGKSEYAESLVMSLGQGRRIYIATMKPWDEECRRRIERHRQMRAKKQFETIECYRGLKEVKLDLGGQPTAVLLECMSNLVSNELFGLGEEGEAPCLEGALAAAETLEGIGKLKEEAEHIVIVTNEVFSDGDNYSKETMAYRKVLGEINQKIAEISDEVIEVVAGIPIMMKKRRDFKKPDKK
ncbi:bifunctional adenosylcobinamide kinase/adenosylcobinamide-phosphate guanylyltransferase [Lacrimispora sphenoides]|uniref:Adenosylcobinamide kinase n=1 Tax=Lacrimispora sphenoides JCM 1415 TaxID=1297793 RepID=A0ABY1C8H8_9FIRM|nr:bifunctional adenosylcobinamide kinase/adenosylcobinamide-phosphate guanylyltransferase [Lacrimispora sphenoides]SET80028.1 adenosylcobinamide kinase / adenosylcobinamide-phosphate guanylyltransferase [[Clostridium] sphenoides JCM 1415]SUY51372.1 cobalbumin biosynthesis protein [Lacrimispora sphenoides]